MFNLERTMGEGKGHRDGRVVVEPLLLCVLVPT